ncbi:hypothetical protein MRX96_028400 [Rhipicephalus microplus]
MEATEHVGEGMHVEVDGVSVGYTDIDRHDSKEVAEEFLDVEGAAVDEKKAEEDAEGDDGAAVLGDQLTAQTVMTRRA